MAKRRSTKKELRGSESFLAYCLYPYFDKPPGRYDNTYEEPVAMALLFVLTLRLWLTAGPSRPPQFKRLDFSEVVVHSSVCVTWHGTIQWVESDPDQGKTVTAPLCLNARCIKRRKLLVEYEVVLGSTDNKLEYIKRIACGLGPFG